VPALDASAPLVLSFAMLHMEADTPGAELWLDGVAIGPAPKSMRVPLGTHTVRAVKRGFTEDKRAVEVGAQGARIVLGLVQEEQLGTLDLFSDPWGQIYIDGRDTGKQTPHKGLRVSAGTHRLKIVNPSLGLSHEEEIEIAPDGRKRVSVTLKSGDEKAPPP
jgi:hypothetical protein